MSQEIMKEKAAQAALAYLPYEGAIGVGTGSTVNYFIDALATVKGRIDVTVASSEATASRLKSHGIAVVDANSVSEIMLYVDGADAFTPHKYLTKGGGAALTREKILADMAKKFVCIADETKKVPVLGVFPLPIEVIPMARSHIARQIVRMGGHPVYREGVVTDNGNVILDVHHLDLVDPLAVDLALNQLPGVVCHGLFANVLPDVLLIGTSFGVSVLD